MKVVRILNQIYEVNMDNSAGKPVITAVLQALWRRCLMVVLLLFVGIILVFGVDSDYYRVLRQSLTEYVHDLLKISGDDSQL